MSDTITRAELAEEAGKLGFAMTGWIYDVMSRREDWNQAAPVETVTAFLAAVRERLNSIEARAGITVDAAPRG
ncbi:hypothetical protein [Methylobacterium sp. GC_Met_2]|uniref:hypothetical protein n=1 Tax=Methylobacterium sp. GC_Met_2 TaxID=2937376 RepID=UPI00226B9B0C|nr:hypothetical protein [Methylobacterium sp. GC_Met_2]